MSLARDERAAICDEFDRSDEHRPTLAAGWDARDLLTHLLVRERQPWTAIGIAVPALAALTERAAAGWASRPWSTMITTLRAGPPAFSPLRIERVDELANGAEFFVHHEDLRRGAPDWRPRPRDEHRDEQVWAALGTVGRLQVRRSSVGVVLQRPDGPARVIRTGDGLVTVIGEPSELMLHVFGRDAARVELAGRPVDVSAYRAVSRAA